MAKKVKLVEKQSVSQYLDKKAKWLTEHPDADVKNPSLSEFLLKDLEKTIDTEEEAYVDALNARTDAEKHEAIMAIIESRKLALLAAADPKKMHKLAHVIAYDDDGEEILADPDDDEDEAPKTPRKKGYLEQQFDMLCGEYEKESQPKIRDELLSFIMQMEISRRVRFFYDMQKLRIGTRNRKTIYQREFGVKDVFIDYAGDQLERMEKHNEKMVDRILRRSPDSDFYIWLRDNHLGIGIMMAGCLIAELGTPERFHSVGSLWSYCGLSVVGNVLETDTNLHDDDLIDEDGLVHPRRTPGFGGHAQRREAGQTANWHHFLKTKLLGVMTGTMIKSQTRHIGTFNEATKGRNVSVLNGYKTRLNIQNNVQPKFFNEKGKEVFQVFSKEVVTVYNAQKVMYRMRRMDIPRRRPGHINNMSKRYMIKMFLIDVLNTWRVSKGFYPLPTYYEAKISGNVRHHGLDLRKRPVDDLRPLSMALMKKENDLNRPIV